MNEHHLLQTLIGRKVKRPSCSHTSSSRPYIQAIYTSSESLRCEPMFRLIEETLKKEGPKYVKKVKAVFAFNVTDGPGGKKERWLVDVKHGNGSVQKGGRGRADCTFTVKDKHLVDMMNGKLQPQSAFFAGKLKITGNMSLAMRLQQIMPKPHKSKL